MNPKNDPLKQMISIEVGAKTVYSCTTCSIEIVTVKAQQGCVPLGCRCIDTNCKGIMIGSYNVYSEQATFEWRQPIVDDFLSLLLV